MKIISWNVNGIRAAHKKGFVEFVEREKPDVLCLQETKALPDQVEPILLSPNSMQGFWSSAQRKGYSGTATFCKNPPSSVELGIGAPSYDQEGRFTITCIGDIKIYNIYFPNGGSGPERHDFKQKFLYDLNEHLRPQLVKGAKLVVVGDYNIAHRAIDIHDPVRLATHSGFLPEERLWFDRFLELGFVDTFRQFYPEAVDRYSWWSYREFARGRNKGWRIDYICVSENLRAQVKAAGIMDSQQGSDHCPVWIDLET